MGAHFPGDLLGLDCSRPCRDRCDGRARVFILAPEPTHRVRALQLPLLFLRPLRRRLSYRHHFAVIVRPRDRTSKSSAIAQHARDSARMYSPWWRRNDGQDWQWSVKTVLTSSWHGGGEDGYHGGDDEVRGVPTPNDNLDGVHLLEPAVQRQNLRTQADQQRPFVDIMASHRGDNKVLMSSSSVKSKTEVMAIHQQGRAGGCGWHGGQRVHSARETRPGPPREGASKDRATKRGLPEMRREYIK